MNRMYRLAVLNSHPIQYFAPLYRRLAQEPDIDLTVYYCSRQGADEYLDPGFGQRLKWDIPLLEGYRYTFLPNLRRQDQVAGSFSLINPSIIAELQQKRYDAICLHGHVYVTDWLGVLGALCSRTPIFYRSESSLTYDSQVRRPLYIRLVKSLVLRTLFAQIEAFLAIGTLNREFYRFYGAEQAKIFQVPYAVDNQYFSLKASEFRERRAELRAAHGLGDQVVFLFAAKMTAKKRPLELLQAFRMIHDVPQAALLMVGDGELREQAEKYVTEHGLVNVHFTGFVNQSQLPKYYAMSDVFVRPDGVYQGDWGLTVNEAMAAGLAIIATDKIGASVDLIRDNLNGVKVRFGDLHDLASAMREIATRPGLAQAMGTRSAEIIRTWSYEECVQGVKSALRQVSNGGK